MTTTITRGDVSVTTARSHPLVARLLGFAMGCQAVVILRLGFADPPLHRMLVVSAIVAASCLVMAGQLILGENP